MDKINKALLKLSDAQRNKLLDAYFRIEAGELAGLDIKKLKGHSSLYRLRLGSSRLIYEKLPRNKLKIIFVGKRDDQTYRDF